MRQSFYLGSSQLTLLILALLCPKSATTYPQSSTVDRHELESTLNDLQAALQNPRDPKPLLHWPQDLLQALLGSEEEEDLKPWAEETLLRAQRGDSSDLPLAHFPRENSLENMHFQEGGEGEEGRKRNDALTSIAGGLQAVSREKGGFGFRFGKKRWTEKRKNGQRGQNKEEYK
ncbi:uncharacterized protein LOC119425786 [Nematolebias whitei]|uniref:uncharacterized protein LOC119425786 n=1 Tax=Nematolebias whitei TaxID=451745 RepID=UPI00189A794F|nr:uncharacterized protein LOC119425786 [Nematolebias whitei]